jgi:hypothetical protein
MSNSFMSPLPTFTLESLVTNGQWAAMQNFRRKKNAGKMREDKPKSGNSAPTSKASRTEQ